MKVPKLKRTPSQSPSAGQSAVVALVSGPRKVMKVFPACRVTAISKWLAATERNVPARSLWLRQIFSTKGESEGLSSNVRSMRLFLRFGHAAISLDDLHVWRN
jgi:hypothetical protein